MKDTPLPPALRALGDQVLQGRVAGPKLESCARHALMQLRAQAPDAAFHGLLQWVRLGLTLQGRSGTAGAEGDRLLSMLQTSPFAKRIVARHHRHQTWQSRRLGRFEARRESRLSAATEVTARRPRPPRGAMVVGQVGDRFSLERRRAGR